MAFRSPQFPLGLSAAPTGPEQAGYRSLLGFWLGGASSGGEIPPEPPAAGGGGWGRISLPSYEFRLRQDFLKDFSEDEQAAILAAIAWVLK